MEKNMENKTKTREYIGLYKLYSMLQISVTLCGRYDEIDAFTRLGFRV